ncbi:MAG: hypothetical protein P8Y58_08790 [Novosphingobium sp.]
MDFFQRYEQAIGWVVSLCPAPDKFAHTYAGLTIWLLAALLFRRPLRSAWPLLTVIGFELVNEAIDRVAHGSWLWHDTLRDMAATWFWPLVLVTCLRLFPFLSGRRPGAHQDLARPSEHHVDRPLPAMTAMGPPDRDDVARVLTHGEPI